jgi:putative salt-induced outer membrane protein
MHLINTRDLTVAAIACAMASTAWAQAKTDGQWRGLAGAALAATTGNSETTAFSLNADMARATLDDKVSLGGNVNYGRSTVDGVKKTTSDKWAGYGQYDYNLSPALFVFGKLGLEGDNIVQLDLRTSLAGGVGYKLIDTKETAFSVFGGAAYSTDKYAVAKTIGDKTDTTFSRASLFLGEESSHQFTASTLFKQRLELYPGLTGDKAKIAKFTAGLAVAMSNTLNLTVGVVDTYNSKPPQGIKKNDLGVFAGVSLKLGAE